MLVETLSKSAAADWEIGEIGKFTDFEKFPFCIFANLAAITARCERHEVGRITFDGLNRCYGAPRNIQKIGGFLQAGILVAKVQICTFALILIASVSTALHIRQPRRDHRALCFVQVASVEVLTDDILVRIIAIVLSRGWNDVHPLLFSRAY